MRNSSKFDSMMMGMMCMFRMYTMRCAQKNGSLCFISA